MNLLREFADMNFGEALGYYLYDQGAITDPRDVGQAEIVREPATGEGHESYPASNYIRYITRSGAPEWQWLAAPASPEETLFNVLAAFVKHRDVVTQG